MKGRIHSTWQSALIYNPTAFKWKYTRRNTAHRKMSYSWQARSRNVRETKGHIPAPQRKQTWEQRRGAKRRFITLQTTGKRGNKTCLCADTFCANFRVHSEVVDTATSVFASKWALLPRHVCPMKSEWLSCLYFPKKKYEKISHDVTMNPSWTHLRQKALPQPSFSFSASFSFPPLPASLFHWAPILFFFSYISIFLNISSSPGLN